MTFTHAFFERRTSGAGATDVKEAPTGSADVSPYFGFAAGLARKYRDDVIRARQHSDFASRVTVVTKALGPDNHTLVPCGEANFPRCVADQFEKGRLTITAIDDRYEMRIYEPDQWDACTVYGPDGHILYSWSNQ